MFHLSIDIETFSSVDLKKSGLYKYVQSPDFQVLLFAYSFNGGPVDIIDLTCGERVPPQVTGALFDANVIKHAYNASFEWYCLSRHFNLLDYRQWPPELWLPQWHCTQLHGLYCGYTRGLAATGEALGLPADKLKDKKGSALIRTFCVPCKPGKSNGNRTRTLPKHEPEKWEMFKAYCQQDVVTEMEIERRLSAFPVAEDIQEQWIQDQRINLRGVAVDMDLMESALTIDECVRERDLAEAMQISGLENPNSRDQLKNWLEEETGEKLADVSKDTVTKMLKTSDDARVNRMLTLRQELSKTSVKKYQAMANTTCKDGRARGLLQFYGANRTGRWSGRALQPQNLPRTHISMLELSRELVKRKNISGLEIIYGPVSGTLSQLIRTALIAPQGKLLCSADFSAIEARVIAWLAGEQWKLDVFATHGKIYEASASQMFGVPIEKIAKGNPEYELRQRGKVAELGLGYGMGVARFIETAATQYNVFFSQEEANDIVSRWKKSNRRIVDMWQAVNAAAIEAMQTGRPTQTHRCIFAVEGDTLGNTFLTITLPGGRRLFYASPHLDLDQWDRQALFYYGSENGKWKRQSTYGGKLVENIVQATARDCLAVAMERVEAAEYPIVFHVHDEIVCEVNSGTAERDLRDICDLMGRPIPWAPGLLLKADGYISKFYKKD